MRPAIIVLVAVLTACAPPKQYQWLSDSGAGQAQRDRDFGECAAYAMAASPTYAAQRTAAIFAACMRGKGWSLVER